MGLYDDTDPFESGFEAGRRHGAREARTDERAKCRAELREKLSELCDTTPRHALWQELLRWARGPEAFGGE